MANTTHDTCQLVIRAIADGQWAGWYSVCCVYGTSIHTIHTQHCTHLIKPEEKQSQLDKTNQVICGVGISSIRFICLIV